MLAREATRKINAIFSQLSSTLLNENKNLKAKVGDLENELKTVTGNFENARMWRENVLNGCPVLFEQSGLLFTLKPFGKLKVKTDSVTERATGPSRAAGKFPLKEKFTFWEDWGVKSKMGRREGTQRFLETAQFNTTSQPLGCTEHYTIRTTP